MKTYPIYQASFGGSSDYMAGSTQLVAAANRREAKKRLLAIQNAKYNVIGRIVKRGTTICDEDTIELVKGIRATKADWREHRSDRH